MGLLKEKLDALSNSQIYALWDCWIRSTQATPTESQIISELLDMAFYDSSCEAELLSEIDKLVASDNIHTMGLLPFLKEQYTKYQKNILPLVPDLYVDGEQEDDDYVAFDAAKNEFLESLWDTIQQHFDDAK